MTELSESDKIKIAETLSEIELTLKRIKPLCTDPVQMDIIKECEKMLDKHRK